MFQLSCYNGSVIEWYLYLFIKDFAVQCNIVYIHNMLKIFKRKFLYVYIVVNGPPNTLRQQRSVIPIASDAAIMSGAAITSSKKQSEGQGKERYTYHYFDCF